MIAPMVHIATLATPAATRSIGVTGAARRGPQQESVQ